MYDFSIGTAASIARALDGVREGLQWRCRCPVHGGHSLTVTESSNGKLLYYCHGAGCSFAEITAALHAEGITGNRVCRDVTPEHRFRRTRGLIFGASLYRRLASPSAGTPVEVYLQSRGITLPPPPALRFMSRCPHRMGWYYPAMVAAITNLDGVIVGCHRTFLTPTGSGKWPFAKKSLQREFLGSYQGYAVQLAPHQPDRELLVGEGIESTLSAMQLFGLPGWAALSTAGLKALELPDEVRRIAIAVDNDRNSAGQTAALSTYYRWKAEGRIVRLLVPSEPDADFNDVLRGMQ